MIKRTLDISTNHAKIFLKDSQLVISREGEADARAPVEDIGVVIIGSHSITLSSGAGNALVENNAVVIFLDGKHMPSGILLPLGGHSTQAETIAVQANAGLPLKKRLWQSVVKAKLMAQARTLEEAGETNGAILAWAGKVRSGDPDNLEARSARFYWPRLFGKKFRRRRNGAAPNQLLNYGYAIQRACVARALVSAGLHPSIGIHHKNKYNNFTLADDMIEPLRPMVDIRVWRLWRENPDAQLDKGAQRVLLEMLCATLEVGGRRAPAQVALSYYTASLRRALAEGTKLDIPVW